MIPYIIAGAIGYGIAKLLEKDDNKKYAEGGELNLLSDKFTETGYETYARNFGIAQIGGFNDEKDINILVSAILLNMYEATGEEEFEDKPFVLILETHAYPEFWSDKYAESIKDMVGDDTINPRTIDYLSDAHSYGLGVPLSTYVDDMRFKTEEEAIKFLNSKKLNDQISGLGMLSGYHFDKQINRIGDTGWKYLSEQVGANYDEYKKGGEARDEAINKKFGIPNWDGAGVDGWYESLTDVYANESKKFLNKLKKKKNVNYDDVVELANLIGQDLTDGGNDFIDEDNLEWSDDSAMQVCYAVAEKWLEASKIKFEYAKGGQAGYEENIEEIVENLDPEAVKFEGNSREGFSVLVKDKNSDFSAFVDVYMQGSDVTSEWNQYIFAKNNSKDMLKSDLQDNAVVFDYFTSEAIHYLQQQGAIQQDDDANWSYTDKYAGGGRIDKMDKFISELAKKNTKEFSVNEYHDFRNKKYAIGVARHYFTDNDGSFSKFDTKLGDALNIDFETQGDSYKYADGGMVFKKGDMVILKDGGGRRSAIIVEDGFDEKNRVRVRPDGFPMDISVPMSEEYSSDKRVYVLHKMAEGGENFMAGGMTNEDILRSFLISNRETQTNNLATFYSTLGDVILLRNYGTLIAKRNGRRVEITNVKYSKTTSAITNRLKALAEEMGYNVSYVSEFAEGGIMADGRIVLRDFNGVGGNKNKTYKLIKDDRDSDGKPYYTLIEYPSGNIMAQGDSFDEVNGYANLMSGKYADGGETDDDDDEKYSIIVWETEEDRDAGESFVAEILTNKQEALEKAEKMYYKQDFSAIEVIDENDEVILHLSSNEEEDDEYARGGGVGEKQYLVKAIVTDENEMEIHISVNVFAKSENSAMDKADDNIREQNPKFEDFNIDIESVELILPFAEGGELKYKFPNGSVVWDKSNKIYGVVLNNFGNESEGGDGELRLDSDGMQSIFKYDKKSNKTQKYNLVPFGSIDDEGNGDLKSVKSSAKRIIRLRKEKKDKQMVDFYTDIYDDLLSGRFDSGLVDSTFITLGIDDLPQKYGVSEKWLDGKLKLINKPINNKTRNKLLSQLQERFMEDWENNLIGFAPNKKSIVWLEYDYDAQTGLEELSKDGDYVAKKDSKYEEFDNDIWDEYFSSIADDEDEN